MSKALLRTEHLVGWQDLDLAGRPHFPNYFLWVSRAFDHFMAGKDEVNWLQWMEKQDIGMPIVHAECDYTVPLSLHDRVTIDLTFQNASPRGFETYFEICRIPQGKTAASGLIRRRFVSPSRFQGVEAPPEIYRLFAE